MVFSFNPERGWLLSKIDCWNKTGAWKSLPKYPIKEWWYIEYPKFHSNHSLPLCHFLQELPLHQQEQRQLHMDPVVKVCSSCNCGGKCDRESHVPWIKEPKSRWFFACCTAESNRMAVNNLRCRWYFLVTCVIWIYDINMYIYIYLSLWL